MDPTHFDAVSKVLASRRTRRTTIIGGLSLAAAARSGRAMAQDATPVGTRAIDPHLRADTATADTEFLFVPPFDGGT